MAVEITLIKNKQKEFDKQFLAPGVDLSTIITSPKWIEHIQSLGNKQGYNILEIGSRSVCAESTWRKKFDKANYIGFDYHPGHNVDVVGDAHMLSKYFSDIKFDLIYSHAVWEHLSAPWIVSEEIAKCLKLNGHLFIESHFSFSVHERPWHFFHFTDNGLKALFPPSLGFKCIQSSLSNPIKGEFTSLADPYLKGKIIGGLYCHCEYLGQKIKEVSDFDWKNVRSTEIVDGREYPKPADLG